MWPAGGHPNEITPAIGSEQRHPTFSCIVYFDVNAIVDGTDPVFKIHDVEIPSDYGLFLVYNYARTHFLLSISPAMMRMIRLIMAAKVQFFPF